MEIKLVKITDDERAELKAIYESKKETNIEDKIAKIENQTLLVLREVKNANKWTDIEEMVDFVQIIKKANTTGDSFILTNSEYDLLLKVFKAVAEDGKIEGFGLEKFVEIYSTIKN